MATEKPVDVELVVPESKAVEPSAQETAQAFKVYQQIQKVCDEQMPDCIITIKGKRFRKKAYWRAIATAFRVQTELMSEDRVEIMHGPQVEDWGYTATYRATTSDGRHCDGDGACMASEKVVYQWIGGKRTDQRDEKKTAENQTVHNIRAHAHTRAKNRAIADLVGFGEVSADELGPDAYRDQGDDPYQLPMPKAEPPHKEDTAKKASEKQVVMLKAKSYSQAEELGQAGEYENIHEYAAAVRRVVMDQLGFEDVASVTFAAVTPMAKMIEKVVLAPDGKVALPGEAPF